MSSMTCGPVRGIFPAPEPHGERDGGLGGLVRNTPAPARRTGVRGGRQSGLTPRTLAATRRAHSSTWATISSKRVSSGEIDTFVITL